MAARANRAAWVLAMVVGIGSVSVEYGGKTCRLGLGATPVLAEETGESRQAIPAALRGFQGMMNGKLLEKSGMSFRFKLAQIMKVWKGNKAENAERAIGETFSLNLDNVSDHHRERIMRNYRGLKDGDQIELEAFDLGKKTLCVKEWLKKAGTKDE